MLSLVALAMLSTGNTLKQDTGATVSPGVQKALNRLTFVANRGQWDHEAKFLARSSGVDVWVTNSGLTYDFHKPAPNPDPTPESQGRPKPEFMERAGHVVKLSFVGALSGAAAVGDGKQAGATNFIKGDQARNTTMIPRYDHSKVTGIYNGVDLVVYADKKTGGPRYDIVLQPGANLSDVKMKYDGVTNLRVRTNGEVSYDTSLGTVSEKGLAAFDVDSDGVRHPVSVRPQLVNGAVTFSVPSHDQTKTLVIDPLIYSTFLGGSDYDYVTGVAVDSTGSAYVSGYTYSDDFPITAGAYDGTRSSTDLFVSKVKPDGSDLVYSTFIGGNSSEYDSKIAVDGAGSAFIVSYSYSSDYPTVNAYQSTNAGGTDAVLSRLSPGGNTLLFSTYLGGSSYDYGFGIALDPSNRPYVVGYTSSTNFPTVTPYQAANGGGYDTFLTRFEANGQTLSYSTYLGGSNDETGYAVAVDPQSRAAVTGYTNSTDFPTKGAKQAVNGGGYDAYLTKFAATGQALVFSTYIGGSSSDYGYAVAACPDGGFVVGGLSYSSDFPSTHLLGASAYGGFVNKYSAGGSRIYSDSTYYNYVYGIAVDSINRAYVISYGYNYVPATPTAFQTVYAGNYDGYMFRLTADGTVLSYATFLGGEQSEYAKAIALDSSNNAYVVGYTYSHDFPITLGAYDTTYIGGGYHQGFVSVIQPTVDTVDIDPVNPIFGGDNVSINVRLSAPAGVGGKSVALGGGAGIITLPGHIIIPEGEDHLTITAATKGVPQEAVVNMTAKIGATTISRPIQVKAATVSAVNFAPGSVVGGSATVVTCKVILNGKAPAGGLKVYLSKRFLPSSLNKATIPASITIGVAKGFGTFTVTHKVTPSIVVLTVTATANGESTTGSMRIKP